MVRRRVERNPVLHLLVVRVCVRGGEVEWGCGWCVCVLCVCARVLL